MSDRNLFLLVLALSVVGGTWSFLDHNRNVRVASVAVVVMLLGSLVLGTVHMVTLVLFFAVAVVVDTQVQDHVGGQITVSALVTLLCVATVSIVQASRRDRLGLRRMSAESVLERVRRRSDQQGAIPELPAGWHVDVAQHSAHRAAFAGDFVSARLHDLDGVPHLELALVDVSGSGIEAGSRALLLSGAVGGLLGAVPPHAFLDRANDYLRRQDWGVGFASASYLLVNLASGRYEVRNAGHPPPIRWSATDHRATHLPNTGTVLGVVDHLAQQVESSRLGDGDALIVYTDGVIEDRVSDMDASIARFEQTVARVLRTCRLSDAAERLLEGPRRGREPDDRTAVVVWYDGLACSAAPPVALQARAPVGPR